MRAVKSESDIRERVEWYWDWNSTGSRVRRSISSLDMSTPAVMTPNLTRLRQLQTIDKSSKKKETYRSRSKKEAPSELSPIGDNLEANGFENPREVKELVRPSTAGKSKFPTSEAVNLTKESANLHNENYKKSSTPVDQPTEKFPAAGDEGFYDEEVHLNPKFTVIQEVKELIRKSEAQKAEAAKNDAKITENIYYKRRRRVWTAVLLWAVTFSGALSFYFSVFVYVYKIEPFYSKVIEMLGWKEEIPPPPPTIKEQFFILLEQISIKLNNVRLSILEKLSFTPV